jgi:phosphatidate phosphatase APP1
LAWQVDWYTLAEDELNWYWNQKAFAPLSDLDETIIHADKIKEDSYV